MDSLAADIRLRYNLDPLEKDTLFLFKGTRNDRLKGLLWTGDRFIMLYIRLANGRFQWPKNADEARTLNSDEFLRLMEGYSIDPSVGKPRQVEKPDFKKARKR